MALGHLEVEKDLGIMNRRGRGGVPHLERGGGTPNDSPKVPNHEKITSGSSGSVSAPGIGSGMLLGTFLGSGDVVGVNSRRHGRDIDSFCFILSGGEAKCPYCSNCTQVRKKRAEAHRGAPEAKKCFRIVPQPV